jgi:imidazolonepropionase-like amidohydrolase
MDAKIEAGVKIALHATGCRDVDAAVKLGAASGTKLTDAGDVDAASVAAAVSAFRAAKPYLFESGTSATAKEPAVEPAKPKSALDMTAKEYKAAKHKLIAAAVYAQRQASGVRFVAAVKAAGKSALEMSDEEYEAVRRLAHLGSPLSPGRPCKENWTGRPPKPSARTGWTSVGHIAARAPGMRSSEPPTWGGLHLRNRSA